MDHADYAAEYSRREYALDEVDRFEIEREEAGYYPQRTATTENCPWIGAVADPTPPF